MNQLTILLLSMTFGLLIYSLIAKWYLLPWVNSVSRKEAFTPLLLLHCFRYIGLAFLIPGVVSPELSSAFANPAAYGDLLAAVLALLALIALRNGWAYALLLIWIFNIEGTLDFVTAIYQGLSFTTPGQLGAAYFIPVVIVPALLVTHFVIFKLLLFRDGSA